MTVRISLAAVFADRIDGVDVVRLGGRTVGEVLHALTERHPALAGLVWTAEGAFNEQLVAFLNRQDVRGLSALDTPVQSGDELMLITAIEGG